jgi:hypothetical protein
VLVVFDTDNLKSEVTFRAWSRLSKNVSLQSTFVIWRTPSVVSSKLTNSNLLVTGTDDVVRIAEAVSNGLEGVYT